MKPILKKFKRICPHCGEEFYQKKYTNKSIDFKYALDGFPITHTDICFDVYAFDYATCPKCGFCYYNPFNKDENIPIAYANNQKISDMIKWFLTHKDMSIRDKIICFLNDYNMNDKEEFNYLYAIQSMNKTKIDIARNILIHKYETQEDSGYIKTIPKDSFLSLKTMSDRRFNTKYTLSDLYRQNGDIIKANQIAGKKLLVFDNFYSKQTHTFSEPFYHNYFKKEINLINSNFTGRV